MERTAMILLCITLAVYFMANVYVFVKLLKLIGRLLSSGKRGILASKLIFAVLFWFAAVALFLSLSLRDVQIPVWLNRIMYTTGSVWLVFILYMVMALLLFDLLRIFVKHPFLKSYGAVPALIVVFSLLLYGYLNYRHPKVEEITIDLSETNVCREETAEASFVAKKKMMRIVAVSDVHLGYATDKNSLQRYVQQINSLLPDIILIGGDLIDNSIVPVEEQCMYEELSILDAPYGVYMVPGNHEYISGMGDTNTGQIGEFLDKTPIVLLRDSVVVLPGGLTIVGRDDRHCCSASELLAKAKTAASATAWGEGPVLFIEHQPRNIALKDSLGVDIQFSGHTHRGQIWPINLLVDRMYEQSHGYRKWSNSHVIVSSGLSLWGPPFRIGTNSDMWVINVQLHPGTGYK